MLIIFREDPERSRSITDILMFFISKVAACTRMISWTNGTTKIIGIIIRFRKTWINSFWMMKRIVLMVLYAKRILNFLMAIRMNTTVNATRMRVSFHI